MCQVKRVVYAVLVSLISIQVGCWHSDPILSGDALQAWYVSPPPARSDSNVPELVGEPSSFEPGRAYVFVGPDDPRLLRVAGDDGSVIDIAGTKDSSGALSRVDSIYVRQPIADTFAGTLVTFDTNGRISRLESIADGVYADLDWASDTLVTVTVAMADGTVIDTTPLTIDDSAQVAPPATALRKTPDAHPKHGQVSEIRYATAGRHRVNVYVDACKQPTRVLVSYWYDWDDPSANGREWLADGTELAEEDVYGDSGQMRWTAFVPLPGGHWDPSYDRCALGDDITDWLVNYLCPLVDRGLLAILCSKYDPMVKPELVFLCGLNELLLKLLCNETRECEDWVYVAGDQRPPYVWIRAKAQWSEVMPSCSEVLSAPVLVPLSDITLEDYTRIDVSCTQAWTGPSGVTKSEVRHGIHVGAWTCSGGWTYIDVDQPIETQLRPESNTPNRVTVLANGQTTSEGDVWSARSTAYFSYVWQTDWHCIGSLGCHARVHGTAEVTIPPCATGAVIRYPKDCSFSDVHYAGDQPGADYETWGNPFHWTDRGEYWEAECGQPGETRHVSFYVNGSRTDAGHVIPWVEIEVKHKTKQ